MEIENLPEEGKDLHLWPFIVSREDWLHVSRRARPGIALTKIPLCPVRAWHLFPKLFKKLIKMQQTHGSSVSQPHISLIGLLGVKATPEFCLGRLHIDPAFP